MHKMHEAGVNFGLFVFVDCGRERRGFGECEGFVAENCIRSVHVSFVG